MFVQCCFHISPASPASFIYSARCRTLLPVHFPPLPVPLHCQVGHVSSHACAATTRYCHCCCHYSLDQRGPLGPGRFLAPRSVGIFCVMGLGRRHGAQPLNYPVEQPDRFVVLRLRTPSSPELHFKPAQNAFTKPVKLNFVTRHCEIISICDGLDIPIPVVFHIFLKNMCNKKTKKGWPLILTSTTLILSESNRARRPCTVRGFGGKMSGVPVRCFF